MAINKNKMMWHGKGCIKYETAKLLVRCKIPVYTARTRGWCVTWCVSLSPILITITYARMVTLNWPRWLDTHPPADDHPSQY